MRIQMKGQKGVCYMSKLRVGLLYGGRSQEHEISIMSARSVFTMADKNKYEIIPLAISKKGYWIDKVKSLKILKDEAITEVTSKQEESVSMTLKYFLQERLDLVFPVLHGPYGEDGRLQGMLEMLDLPYVGAGVLSSAAGMDKAIMKNLFSYHKIPQGKYKIVYKYDIDKNFEKLKREIEEEISWPCFIKPANMGSSIGISKVSDPDKLYEALQEAFKYDHKAVIEEFIPGREVECSVFGNIEIKASLPGEIKATHEFYDYNAKYEDNSTELIIPAKLDDGLIEQIRRIAVKSFKAIDGRGFARVDFFISDNHKVLVNEINTIPGFTRYSMYSKMWEATGIKYPVLIDKLINLALEWQSL